MWRSHILVHVESTLYIRQAWKQTKLMECVHIGTSRHIWNWYRHMSTYMGICRQGCVNVHIDMWTLVDMDVLHFYCNIETIQCTHMLLIDTGVKTHVLVHADKYFSCHASVRVLPVKYLNISILMKSWCYYLHCICKINSNWYRIPNGNIRNTIGSNFPNIYLCFL